jgi:hypothetical protein
MSRCDVHVEHLLHDVYVSVLAHLQFAIYVAGTWNLVPVVRNQREEQVTSDGERRFFLGLSGVR